MPAPYGVVPSGFNLKRLEDIQLEMEDAARSNWGSDMNVSASSPMGQFIGIFASQLAECWETVEVAYHGFDPDAAEGFLLIFLASLTGTVYQNATKSTAKASALLDPFVTVPAGKIVAHADYPNRRFIVKDPVTNPNGVATLITTMVLESEEDGVVEASIGKLTTIVTPVPGWTSVTNTAAAIPGLVEDTDETLRARRQRELTAQGGSTVEGVAADVSKLPYVTTVSWLENDTESVDVNGLPPHTFEILVYKVGGLSGSEFHEIAQVIWNNKPSGIHPVGSDTGNAVDKNSDLHVMRFTELTEVEIEVDALYTKEEPEYQGDDSVVDAVLLAGNKHKAGQTVSYDKIRGTVALVEGVVTITHVYMQRLGDPNGVVDVPIGVREIAVFSEANISANVDL